MHASLGIARATATELNGGEKTNMGLCWSDDPQLSKNSGASGRKVRQPVSRHYARGEKRNSPNVNRQPPPYDHPSHTPLRNSHRHPLPPYETPSPPKQPRFDLTDPLPVSKHQHKHNRHDNENNRKKHKRTAKESPVAREVIQDADVELVIDDTTQQQLNTQQQQNHVRVSNSTHGTKKGKGKERGNTGEQTTKSRKKKKKHRNKKKHSSSKQHQTPQLDHDDKENRTHGRAPTSCPPPAAVGNGDGANGMANGYAHHPHHHDTTNRKRTGLASRRENGIKRQETHVANAGKRTEKDKDTSHCRQKTEPVFDVGSHLASVRNQLLSYKGASDDGEDEEIEDLLEELHERWHQIDLNKSGFVSRKELVHAVWMSNGNGASSPPAWAQFPAHLQAMVEDIMVSVKEYESGDIAELNTSLAEEERSEDQRFSFWQFANYFVRQEDPNCQILISM